MIDQTRIGNPNSHNFYFTLLSHGKMTLFVSWNLKLHTPDPWIMLFACGLTKISVLLLNKEHWAWESFYKKNLMRALFKVLVYFIYIPTYSTSKIESNYPYILTCWVVISDKTLDLSHGDIPIFLLSGRWKTLFCTLSTIKWPAAAVVVLI